DVPRGNSFSSAKSYNAEEAFALFAEEKCLMLRQEGSAAYALTKTNAALAARLAFLPIKMPGADDSVNTGITVRSKGYWAINKNAPEKNIQQAVDFLAWYYLGAYGQSLTSGLLGLMSFNLLAPDTSIMGSTLFYIKNNRILADCAQVMGTDAAETGGAYLMQSMTTAKWTEETYAGFAKSMQALWQ
ncbi:MAG: hypothetical protein PHG02_10370, partial [Oscillospiraceae bacterium]|nr:hypothetical protein [Oscillospiraceae bacterium]